MIVKKFEAPSLEQALARVKHELGPNALILSTQQKKGGKWFQKSLVEVTAAFERRMREELEERFDESELKNVFPHRRVEAFVEERAAKLAEAEKKPSSGKPSPKPRVTAEAKAAPASVQGEPSKFELDFLNRGFSPESARELSRRLVFDYPAKELANPEFLGKTKAKLVASPLRTLTPAIFQSKWSWAILGQPGAGKTTYAVKLALFLQAKKETVQLISVDEKKVMGRSELAAYAKLINVPFSHEVGAQTPGTRMQIVDTPALNLGSEQEAARLEKVCRNRSTILVVDAGARLKEILRVVDASARFAPVALAFTRLDQVAEPGIIYDVLKQTKLPLLGLSMKGGLKDAMRFFESMELANFIVGNPKKKEIDN